MGSKLTVINKTDFAIDFAVCLVSPIYSIDNLKPGESWSTGTGTLFVII